MSTINNNQSSFLSLLTSACQKGEAFYRKNSLQTISGHMVELQNSKGFKLPGFENLKQSMMISNTGIRVLAGLAFVSGVTTLSLGFTGTTTLISAAVLTFIALQKVLCWVLNQGKNIASLVAAPTASLLTEATASSIALGVLPHLAAGLQVYGLCQELKGISGVDDQAQQLGAQAQKWSGSIWSNSLLNQAGILAPKYQSASLGLTAAMILVTSPLAKTENPTLEKLREKAAVVSNTAFDVMSVASLGYRTLQCTQTPSTAIAVAGLGLSAVALSKMNLENPSLQHNAEQVVNLMGKLTNSIALGCYVGKYSPEMGVFVGTVSSIVSLAAFAKTQGFYSNTPIVFLPTTKGIQSKKQIDKHTRTGTPFYTKGQRSSNTASATKHLDSMKFERVTTEEKPVKYQIITKTNL